CSQDVLHAGRQQPSLIRFIGHKSHRGPPSPLLCTSITASYHTDSLGGEGRPPPAFSSAGAGRVRGWWACARPFAVHVAPLKASGNDHATSGTFSGNLGTALRCLWFQGIDPLTPGPYRR